MDTLAVTTTNSVVNVTESNGLGLNAVNAGAGNVLVTLTAGAVTDANAATLNVTAGILRLAAPGGVGTQADLLETAAAALSTTTTGGSVWIGQTGNLALGSDDATFGGPVSALGTASVVGTGNLTDGRTGADVTAPAVYLEGAAIGTAGADVDVNAPNVEFKSTSGDTYVSNLGTAGVTLGGALAAAGGVSAAGSFVLTSSASPVTVSEPVAAGQGVTIGNVTGVVVLNAAVTASAGSVSLTNTGGDLIVNAAVSAGGGVSATVNTSGNVTVTAGGSVSAAGAVVTSNPGDLTINGPVTAGTSVAMTASNPAGATVAVNAAVTGTASGATITGGAAADAFNVAVGPAGNFLALDGGAAGDAYNVTTGTLGTGGEIRLTDAGPGGTDVANFLGRAGADTFGVNQAPFAGYVVSGTGEKVRFAVGGSSTVERLTFDGKDGADAVTVYLPGLGVADVRLTDTGTTGADTATLTGADNQSEMFRVNFGGAVG